MLSEDDALIVDALQVAPRAPWSAVGDVLGIAPTTAAKRFQRLVDEGIAWVTASPGMMTSSSQCYAHVEVTCRAGTALRVANAVAAHPLAVTVEVITGAANLMVTVGAADLPTVSHYVLHHLDEVAGVLSTRTSVVTRLYSEGGSWRLRRLPDAAERALVQLQASEDGDEEPPQPSGLPSDTGKAIVELLTADGRMAYAEIAERLNLSPTTARRRTAELLRSGLIRIRTDVAAQDAGWPVENYVRADVPVSVLRATAQQLSRMRQSRLTATVAAGPQLLQSSWLETVEEVHRLELSMAEQHPQLQIVERLLVLSVIKRMGRLIGADGRATGVVPVNIWDDELCEPVSYRAPGTSG
jgi:DNA-binding Lrp family transcriptional regulator